METTRASDAIGLRSRADGVLVCVALGGGHTALQDGRVDLGDVAGWVAQDPARPAALEYRVTVAAAPGVPSSAGLDHVSAHLTLRFDPIVAPAAAQARGSATSAVVAAAQRMSRGLRRGGLPARLLGPAEVADRVAAARALGALPTATRTLRPRVGLEVGSVVEELVATRVRFAAVSLTVDLRRPGLPTVTRVCTVAPTPARAQPPPSWGGTPTSRVAGWFAGRTLRILGPPAGPIDLPEAGASSALFLPWRPVRAQLPGGPDAARAAARQLASAGCEVTVLTGRRTEWAELADQVVVTDRVAGWGVTGRRAVRMLIVDLPLAPPTGFAGGPWSCVAHCAGSGDASSGHGSSGDAGSDNQAAGAQRASASVAA